MSERQPFRSEPRPDALTLALLRLVRERHAEEQAQRAKMTVVAGGKGKREAA